MLTVKRIKKRFGGNVCRQCINKTYHIHLRHKNCIYALPFPALCQCCREMKNIVTGLRFSGYLITITK